MILLTSKQLTHQGRITLPLQEWAPHSQCRGRGEMNHHEEKNSKAIYTRQPWCQMEGGTRTPLRI